MFLDWTFSLKLSRLESSIFIQTVILFSVQPTGTNFQDNRIYSFVFIEILINY